jgi:hypothetical protein
VNEHDVPPSYFRSTDAFNVGSRHRGSLTELISGRPDHATFKPSDERAFKRSVPAGPAALAADEAGMGMRAVVVVVVVVVVTSKSSSRAIAL